MKIILASQSPRRKEILSFFKLPFVVQVSGFDESSIPFEGNPAEYVMKQSCAKGLHIQRSQEDVIISADTTVYCHKRLYEKPVSESQAREFLYALRGMTHMVYTGLTIIKGDQILQDVGETSVTFHDCTDQQIEGYLNLVFPLDKAAGYAIQGAGSLIVKEIRGCYYNVMGLPIAPLTQLLDRVGINLWHSPKN